VGTAGATQRLARRVIARIEEKDSGFQMTPPKSSEELKERRGTRELERSKSIAKFNGPPSKWGSLKDRKALQKSNSMDGGDALKFCENSSTQTTCMCCYSKRLRVCAMGLRQHPRHLILWLERALAATP
jgi:hypothetical protein